MLIINQVKKPCFWVGCLDKKTLEILAPYMKLNYKFVIDGVTCSKPLDCKDGAFNFWLKIGNFWYFADHDHQKVYIKISNSAPSGLNQISPSNHLKLRRAA